MTAAEVIATAKGAQDVVSILGVVAGALTVLAGALASLQLRELRAQRRVLSTIAVEDRADRVQEMDLPSLQTYLFDTLGSMSIREYARDQDAQRFVARAVDRVEEFLKEGERGEGEVPRADHLDVAADAIARGDLVAGLARLRLAVELGLRDVALSAGLPAERATGGRLIEMLRRANLVDPQTADALSYAVKVSNRAVHGQTVEPGQAHEVLEIVRRALTDVTQTVRDRPPEVSD
jgi:hypothetical protein